MIAEAPVMAGSQTTLSEQLAALIREDLAGTADGHCVRVNYLDRDDALAVCQQLAGDRCDDSPAVWAYTLGNTREAATHPLVITPDRAIELRNRKQARLCLFVPADLVDATISSLGNSFAELDGRELQRRALDRLLAGLSETMGETLPQLRAALTAGGATGTEAALGFVLAAAEREQSGQLETPGLELWRLGLIADARPDFDRSLSANRRSAGLLARPKRLDLPVDDRIKSLKVRPDTGRELKRFFARRPLHDVRQWSRALAEDQGPTFDRWQFVETEQPTDLMAVTIPPFLDEKGAVTRQSKLGQPHGPGTPLVAEIGEKCVLPVRWVTDPLKPANVHAWSLALVPAGESDEAYLDLPSREIRGTARTGRLKLDFDVDELPETPFCARVAAIDEIGNELVNAEEEPLIALSDPFFLVKDAGFERKEGQAPRRKTAPTLALARLQAALEVKESQIDLGQPSWDEAAGTAYFTARVNERVILAVGLSPLMLDLERRTLATPRDGGRWQLELAEVEPATPEMIESVPVAAADDEGWTSFWRSRTNFFDRLRRQLPRDVIEVAEWTPELIDTAVRYAKSYTALLSNATPAAVADALSLETLRVRVNWGDRVDEALVVLPTHPLRVAWYAAYAALLGGWEHHLLGHDRAKRKKLIDLELVRDLTPINVPPFAHDWEGRPPFVFFQNLRFFLGVALPAEVLDPQRRSLDLAHILGFGDEPGAIDDRQPARLARHLAEFQRIHPYADPLRLTLINPDEGQFVAAALDELLSQESPARDGEEPEPVTMPALDVTALVLENAEQTATLAGLDRLRSRQIDYHTRQPADALHPGLRTTVRSLADTINGSQEFASGHLAMVSDISQPSIRPVPADASAAQMPSIALYGLIARFAGSFAADENGIRWRYRVIPASAAVKPDPHPAAAKLSEALLETQAALAAAGGRLISGSAGAVPSLEIGLDAERVRWLDQLHAATDWVVTVDRFFGIDYYDSPRDDALASVAQKYLIDYAPAFSEGLGHRMMVTTAWRDEVALFLRRAMEDLGFPASERGADAMLEILKTASGRLALQALGPDAGATTAVSLGAVMAWLRAKHRLDQAVLVPMAAHAELWRPAKVRRNEVRPRLGGLLLVGLRRGIVEATFIEVKWRRGPLGNLDDLVQDMDQQLRLAADAFGDRFFNPDRVDGALQRVLLANVLRFYASRARRYGLMTDAAEAGFQTHLALFEKQGLDFRPSLEGIVISLEDPGRRPLIQDNLTIRVLTANDFGKESENSTPVRRTTQVGPKPDGAARTSSPVETKEPAKVAPAAKEPDSPVLDNAPPEVDGREPVEASEQQPLVVELGASNNQIVDWQPSVKGSPHLFITGIPGQGKSWTVLRLLIELARQGVPALVFDFHGPLADPAGPYARVSQPLIVDAAQGLPFSPFECTADSSALGWNNTAMTVSEIFDSIVNLGDIQRDALFTCIRDAYRTAGFGTTGDAVPDRFPSLEDVHHRIEMAERQKRVKNLIPRCRPLLELDIFRPPADGQSTFAAALQHGLVVDLHRLGSETLQLAASAFLLRKVYRDMFQWGEADRLRLVIVLDEAHRLARDITLPKIMKESRKYGVAVVVASQGLADFHPDVLNNAGTKIAFRANSPESRKIAGFFRARAGYDLMAQLESLQVGNALVQTPEMALAARVAMLPPPEGAR